MSNESFIERCAATWVAVGSLADTLGHVERAVEAFTTALRYTPNNASALTHLAHVYRTRDAYAEAADLYRRALALDQNNGELWGLLGHCYLMLDDLQSAYTSYQQALLNLQNLSVPKLWHGIGILYDRYGSLEYAEEAFVRVLEMDPNFDKANEVYFRLGIIYKLQGKLGKALECFQYILATPPAPLTQTDVWFQIGSVLEQNGDYMGSKEAYERVLHASPNHAKVLQQLGGLYSQQDAPFYDLDAALRLLGQSIELNNTDAHSWYYLGRVYMSKQDFSNAYESFQHAVNLDARNPTFWCSIGVLYYKISQYKDALDAYTRAIRLNPYLSEVWYDLGTLYETCNNQISDALDAYRHAASLDPNNPHIKERLAQLSKYEKEGGQLPPPVQSQRQLTMPSHQMIQQQQQQQQIAQASAGPLPGQQSLGQQFAHGPLVAPLATPAANAAGPAVPASTGPPPLQVPAEIETNVRVEAKPEVKHTKAQTPPAAKTKTQRVEPKAPVIQEKATVAAPAPATIAKPAPAAPENHKRGLDSAEDTVEKRARVETNGAGAALVVTEAPKMTSGPAAPAVPAAPVAAKEAATDSPVPVAVSAENPAAPAASATPAAPAVADAPAEPTLHLQPIEQEDHAAVASPAAPAATSTEPTGPGNHSVGAAPPAKIRAVEEDDNYDD